MLYGTSACKPVASSLFKINTLITSAKFSSQLEHGYWYLVPHSVYSLCIVCSQVKKQNKQNRNIPYSGDICLNQKKLQMKLFHLPNLQFPLVVGNKFFGGTDVGALSKCGFFMMTVKIKHYEMNFNVLQI